MKLVASWGWATILLLGAAAPGWGASVPEWLAAANRVDLGQFGQGSAAVVVEDWRDFTVDAAGKFVSTERRAIRVLNRRSAEPYLRAEGLENSDSTVTSLVTWSLSPSGRVLQSDKKDITTRSDFASFELFSDAREKMVTIPGAEEGSLVGYEIVRQGRIPINSLRFALEDEIPVRQAELHVSAPSGSLRWFLNHPERVEVLSQSATEASFRAVARPAIPHEEDSLPFASLAAEVAVNYDPAGAKVAGSWEEEGQLYDTLFQSAEEPGAEIAAQVEQLTAGKADTLARLDAVYTFVSRQVRYVAIEIGVGGYRPHPVSEIYKYRYGDCKDKATLLLAMMNRLGLRGYPALVGTRGDIEADPKVATLATFDHMIVALPVPPQLRSAVAAFAAYDGQSQILWVDPTSESDPLGQLPEMDQGVYSLVAYPQGGKLERIPETAGDQNGVNYKAQARLEADGSGSAQVEVQYEGASNARRHQFYRGRSQAEIRTGFEQRVARYLPQASFQRASINGIEDNRQAIVETFSFGGQFATAFSGDSWFFQPLFLSGMGTPELTMRPRELPLDIGIPHHITGEYRVELPADMRLAQAPEKISLQSEFGELTVDYAAAGNVLTAKQNLAFRVSRIPPEKYAAFRDFVNNALRAEKQRMRVVKAAVAQ